MPDEKLIALREALRAIHNNGNHDPEAAHANADDLLLEYIADEETSQIYNSIHKWYA